MMDKNEFRIKHFEETGGWLSEDALDEFYEIYVNDNKELHINKIKCPKCEHEFEFDSGEFSEIDIVSSKKYQKAGFEYLQRLIPAIIN